MSAHSVLIGAVLAAYSLRSTLAATDETTTTLGAIKETSTTTMLGEEWTLKPECAMEERRYIDRHDLHFDLTTSNSVVCQEKCRANVTCVVFTYYPDSKACWLQTVGSTLNRTDPGVYAIAGPQACPSATTTTTTGSAGGFPWWGVVLIALGVLLCLLALSLVYYLMNRKKSQRRPKKTKRAIREEVPLAPASAPAAALVPAQYYTPVQTYAAPPVDVRSTTPFSFAAPAPAAPALITTVAHAAGTRMPAGGSFVVRR